MQKQSFYDCNHKHKNHQRSSLKWVFVDGRAGAFATFQPVRYIQSVIFLSLL